MKLNDIVRFIKSIVKTEKLLIYDYPQYGWVEKLIIQIRTLHDEFETS